MADVNFNYVNREEFNSLKEEVQELKEEVSEYKKLLIKIDKKCDVITEKIANGEKIDELTLKPMNNRIQKLEDTSVWLQRLLAGTIIGIVIKVFFEVAKNVNI